MSGHRRMRFTSSLAGAAVLTAAAMIALPSLALGSSIAAAAPARTVIDGKQAQGGGGGHGGGGGGGTPTGYDISYPQCGHAFPTNVLFGIVGVNKGIVYSPNPCLGANGTDPSELAWAETNAPTGEHAQLYANTADPGPAISSYWPDGSTAPEPCNTEGSDVLADRDTIACNYDYGWYAAEDSYLTAVAAYTSLGDVNQADASATPYENTWWLDVETANSWRTDTTRNAAALQGAADYLASRGVTAIGFYSTPTQWATITGNPVEFTATGTPEGVSNYPSWVAGARTLRGAQSRCSSTTGFTGGQVALAQYFSNSFDADLRC